MNISCSAEPCPVILNSTCVYYAGANLIYTGISTNDNLQLILQKIDNKFKDAGLGYIFQNGVIQLSPGAPVKLGGSLNQDTSIDSNGFTFALSGTIESSAFITTGGTSSQFVKGDGSLDSTVYQTAGNYITALTGDGTAVGPGSAAFTLANTGVIANTYGSASQVPVITVDAKGRITNVTNTAISYPAALLLFSGDVTGAGLTGANVTLTLNNVNSGVFPAITPLKFSVNAKGLVTGASALTNLDIFALIGYTPVPQTRTLTINGQTYDLSANRSWTVSGLPSQTGNAGKYLKTDGTNASWQTVDALPTQTGNAGKFLTTNGTVASWSNLPPSGVTSVGLSMPSAFTVTNSPVTSSGTLTVTGAGTASQYIRGDGQLATLPSSPSGGGASISYYLNGSIPASVVGYQQLSKNPVIGPGTDFSTSTDGLIAQFLTDPGDPNILNIPGGNFLLDFYFSASSAGGTPNFYVELYKYDGAVFTLISSNSATPEFITNGTSIDFYTTSLAVSTTTLALTDRLAVRVYVACDGRTITLHTENSHLCEIVTTLSTGISALNGLIAQVQFLSTGTSGTDFNISSATATHTFNLPVASATNTGKLSSTDWSTFNGKQDVISLTTTGSSGSATLISNTLNIPTYTLAGLGGQPQLNGTGFVKATGTTITYDNSTYVTSNIYTADGTLSGNRTVTLGGNSLKVLGSDVGASNYILTLENNNTSAGFPTRNGLLITTTGSVGGAQTASLPLLIRTYGSNVFSVNGLGAINTLSTITATGNISGDRLLGAKSTLTGTNAGIVIETIKATASQTANLTEWQNSAGTILNTIAADGNTIIGGSTSLPSAKLQVESTTQGFLPPRMTTVNKNAIAAPAQGLIVYDTTSDRLNYRDATSWEEVATTADLAPISTATLLFNYYNFY